MLLMNSPSQLARLQKRIHDIQHQLARLGPMRPGCLSLQYRKPKEKAGAYYQLSYTYQMKSKSEYIPADLVPQIEQELAEYKRYRQLTAGWVDLSIALSRLKMTQWKQTRAAD
jgi:hypothetical protein